MIAQNFAFCAPFTRAEGGQVQPVLGGFSRCRKQPGIEVARRQGDLILKNLFAKKRPCKQGDPEKDNRLPTQPARRKSAPLRNPNFEQN